MKKIFKKVFVVVALVAIFHMGISVWSAMLWEPPKPEPTFKEKVFSLFGKKAEPAPVKATTGEKLSRWFTNQWKEPMMDIIGVTGEMVQEKTSKEKEVKSEPTKAPSPEPVPSFPESLPLTV